MKKIFLFISLVFILAQTSCGPAAESRESMHKRAKEVQDSIANSIKSAIAEVEGITAPAPVVDTTQKAPQ
ncbi:hypothetical protein [Sediminibacterium sp.]|uniref:hypothetical protein n=1 Tax=Sediminibacterium sp. TaxID=1917865 RepID=UPI00271B1570|nr:hypothetical protein [Sediminibacterium sp.]MDO9000446.1 hypothetical protein [Bacteroidota bacterium]MDP3146986.1 hypothetical protein [Bacteroidota bacterium]MDP3567476.1 hypothetical protein [Sediminibacterium sp.]